MRLKRFVATLSLILCFSLLFTTSAITYELNVLPILKLKSNWCWVATAQMVAKYKYPNISKSQESCVIHIKGSAVNEGGNEMEHRAAILYFSNDNMAYVRGTFGLNRNLIQTSISKGYPMTLGVVSPNHVYVIKGINTASVPENDQLILINPDDASICYTFYSNLLNGTWSGGTYNDHFYSNMI